MVGNLQILQYICKHHSELIGKQICKVCQQPKCAQRSAWILRLRLVSRKSATPPQIGNTSAWRPPSRSLSHRIPHLEAKSLFQWAGLLPSSILLLWFFLFCAVVSYFHVHLRENDPFNNFSVLCGAE